MTEWISVDERLPEKDGRYLVYAKSLDANHPFYALAWRNAKKQCWELIPHVWADAVSHWMLLAPPEKVQPEE